MFQALRLRRFISLITHFRKRLGADIIQQINDWILEEETARKDQDEEPSDSPASGRTSEGSSGNSNQSKNNGTIMLDATCAPADIAYPTDLKLLHEARKKLEHIIDMLHEPFIGEVKKPRTYRQIARKRYLEIAKKRRVGAKSIRKAIGKQLRYVSRNLRIVKLLTAKGDLSRLNTGPYLQLLVISELYCQQQQMYAQRSHAIEDRIALSACLNPMSVRSCAAK